MSAARANNPGKREATQKLTLSQPARHLLSTEVMHTSRGAARISRADGFSLIELITVVAIIAILAAIAMQAVGAYRSTAYDARAMHDLGNAVNAEEAYYATNQSYITFSATGPLVVDVPGVAVSGTVTLEMEGDREQFSGSSTSTRGTKVFKYDSITDTFINE